MSSAPATDLPAARERCIDDGARKDLVVEPGAGVSVELSATHCDKRRHANRLQYRAPDIEFRWRFQTSAAHNRNTLVFLTM